MRSIQSQKGTSAEFMTAERDWSVARKGCTRFIRTVREPAKITTHTRDILHTLPLVRHLRQSQLPSFPPLLRGSWCAGQYTQTFIISHWIRTVLATFKQQVNIIIIGSIVSNIAYLIETTFAHQALHPIDLSQTFGVIAVKSFLILCHLLLWTESFSWSSAKWLDHKPKSGLDAWSSY